MIFGHNNGRLCAKFGPVGASRILLDLHLAALEEDQAERQGQIHSFQHPSVLQRRLTVLC